MPDQRVAGQLHVVLASELYKGVRGCPIVAVLSRPRMNTHPLHLVLGHDLIKLFLNEGDVLADIIRGPAEAGVAGRDAAVDRCAHLEGLLEGIFQRCPRLGGMDGRGSGQQHRHEQTGSQVVV